MSSPIDRTINVKAQFQTSEFVEFARDYFAQQMFGDGGDILYDVDAIIERCAAGEFWTAAMLLCLVRQAMVEVRDQQDIAGLVDHCAQVPGIRELFDSYFNFVHLDTGDYVVVPTDEEPQSPADGS